MSEHEEHLTAQKTPVIIHYHSMYNHATQFLHALSEKIKQ